MAGTSETAIANGRLVKAGGFAGKFAVKLTPLWGVFGRAFETEVALRRPFLWLPVAAGKSRPLHGGGRGAGQDQSRSKAVQQAEPSLDVPTITD
jgi:hypothetical protein